jgi:hypothetical protein
MTLHYGGLLYVAYKMHIAFAERVPENGTVMPAELEALVDESRGYCLKRDIMLKIRKILSSDAHS